MLGHESGGVDDLRLDSVAKLVEDLFDHSKSIATVVALQVLDVLEKKRGRPLRLEDTCDIEKERSLGFVGEPMGPSQRILLGDTGDRKWLAGKTRDQNIVIRNLIRVNLCDVSGDLLVTEVFTIGQLRVLVPLARKNALTSSRLEPEAHSADSGEQVDEREIVVRRQGILRANRCLDRHFDEHPGRNAARVAPQPPLRLDSAPGFESNWQALILACGQRYIFVVLSHQDPCDGVSSGQIEKALAYLESLVTSGDSLAQAVEALRELTGSNQVADCARQKYLDLADEKARSSSGGWIESDGFQHWYMGKAGNFWLSLQEILAGQGWADSSIKILGDAADGIVTRMANPSGEPDKRYGLVVGYVQSGKTTNFTSVIAKAADNGYKMFIVLSGMSNALREQTQSRLEAQLISPNLESCYRLTSLDEVFADGRVIPGDFSGDKNITALLGQNASSLKAIGVVKKNGHRLRSLRDWLEAASPLMLENCPTLIIDDEADQASINVAKLGDDPTVINGLVNEIIGLLPKVTYIGYTATPFANVLIDASDENDLYPRDFIHSLDRPKGYFGTETIHGREPLERDNDGDDPSGDGYDMVRLVPDSELGDLVPASREIDEFVPAMTDSLRDALRYFWLATAARRVRTGGRQHASMLVHTSMRVAIHSQFRHLMQAERDNALRRIEAGDDRLDQAFRELWEAEVVRVPVKTQDWDNMPVRYDELKPLLAEVVADTKVIEENAQSTDRLDYGTDPKTMVVVGGNTVARGLTLEGLTSSFFVRSAGAYDTLLQMGRWFGFRPGYEDLPRIWTSSELDGWFHQVATVEQEVRYDIERYETEDLSPREFGVRLRTHPAIAITAAAKMRNAVKAQVSYSGRRVQTILFNHWDEDWLKTNISAVRNLVGRALATGGDLGVEPEEGCWIFRDLSADSILEFLDEYQFHESAREVDGDRLSGYIRSQLANGELERWTVAVLGRTSPSDHLGDIDLGLDAPVNLINRSRMRVPDEYASIKGLMSKKDRAIDLEVSDDDLKAMDGAGLAALRNSDDAGSQTGRLPGRGDDSGLLAIYPIGKDSVPRNVGDPDGRRVRLEAVDHVMGAALVFPEARTDEGAQDYVTADLSHLVYEEITEEDVADPDLANEGEGDGFVEAKDGLERGMEIVRERQK